MMKKAVSLIVSVAVLLVCLPMTAIPVAAEEIPYIDIGVPLPLPESPKDSQFLFTPDYTDEYTVSFIEESVYSVSIYDASDNLCASDKSFVYSMDCILTAGETYTFHISRSWDDWAPRTMLLTGTPRQDGYFEYMAGNGKAIITDCSNWAAGELVVPDTLDGFPVTTIGDSTFNGLDGITNLVLPDSVTTIGAYAFANTPQLQEMVIPDSVTTIGAYAFERSGIRRVQLPAGLTQIPSYMFYYCDSLIDIVIPEGVTSIGYDAFCESGLRSVTIPASVTYIDSYAFGYCYSLTEVYIADMAAWCRINFVEGVANPLNYGAFLYLDGQPVTDLMIPEGITEIRPYAFYNCDSITSVTLPESVEAIGAYAFQYCYALTTVTLTTGVTTIGAYAFEGSNLTDVLYNGTLEQRNQIQLGATNSSLLKATWHFGACVDHVYDGVCDDTCNNCSWSRSAPPHTYISSYDPDCSVCGHVRPVPMDGTPCFVVDAPALAREGSTFTVAVKMENNPGIISMDLRVRYDYDVLELVSAESADFGNAMFGPIYANPFAINWYDGINGNYINDGTVAVLTFRVLEGAALGRTEITVTYAENAVFDNELNNVGFAVVDGVVNVEPRLPGDANGDGLVNIRDLGILQRYLVGWDVQVVLSVCDVNKDGNVDNKDLVLIQRWLCGWDVELL